MEFGNVNDWRSDRTRELEGVVCDLGEGRELIVRRAGSRNRAYMAGVAGIEPGDITALERLFAETIVCNWRGIRDKDGAEIPFSPAACAELFSQAPDLADHVARFAANRAHYHAEELERDADSLKATPGG
jgi:hypothetical protein